jgi:hypothetical protein
MPLQVHMPPTEIEVGEEIFWKCSFCGEYHEFEEDGFDCCDEMRQEEDDEDEDEDE